MKIRQKARSPIRLTWIAAFMAFFMAAFQLHAAVGCDLNDPDRDVKRLFPESTGYKTLYVSIDRKGGEALLREIERRLGDTFKGLFETADVPYTMYEIYQRDKLIGYIHGVNQKGEFGGIQVFLALDLEGRIRSFYFQKLTSKAAKLFRDPKFGELFIGLTLKDFYAYDVATGKETPPGRISRVVNPSPEAESDFRAALRAAKKNLILVDEFLLGNKYLQYFKPSGQGGTLNMGAGSRSKAPVAEGGPPGLEGTMSPLPTLEDSVPPLLGLGLRPRGDIPLEPHPGHDFSTGETPELGPGARGLRAASCPQPDQTRGNPILRGLQP